MRCLRLQVSVSLLLLVATATATSLAVPAMADCQGEFTPLADGNSPFTKVHFFPKNGNHILIGNQLETIPPGIGVMSGGVIGAFNNASIDKMAGHTLKPNTTYYVYVYMLGRKMILDFSMTGHKEDETNGTEVNAADSGRSLVGMVHTNVDGKFVGSNKAQMTLSWCNQGETGLIERLDKDGTGSPVLSEVNPARRLEWLQWGINNSFKQGFTVPNIYVATTVRNDTPGSLVQVAIGIDGTTPVSLVGMYYQADPKAVGFVGSAVIGANGADEGYHYATFLMSNGGGGGAASVVSGAIYSSPLHS
jgi:hypothetical protein